MADDERPRPPAALEPSLRAALVELAERDPDSLPAVAAYAEELAAWVESDRSDGDEDEESTDDADGRTHAGPDDYPPGVPEHATVTITEIAGTRYRYYQWREGDEIKSETVEV